MGSSNLNLVFLKGPRKGETLQFRSGSTVRIGRVVRGNSVAIKDPGISSKHLLIEFVSGKWMVQDLGSSNGTGLNSTPIVSFEPHEVRENDIINLGESTSLLVNIGVVSESPYGRGKRTRGRTNAVVETPKDDGLNKENNTMSRVRASRSRKNLKPDEMGTSGRAKRTKRNDQVFQLETVREDEENQPVETRVSSVKVKEETVEYDVVQKLKGNAGFDWKKLTLGEWFDFMEEYLTKQMVGMSEATIAEMKQKAESICELGCKA